MLGRSQESDVLGGGPTEANKGNEGASGSSRNDAKTRVALNGKSV